jgi:PHD/YefM family antitoxin component YafN of YafNO toxin-antitoxin module
LKAYVYERAGEVSVVMSREEYDLLCLALAALEEASLSNALGGWLALDFKKAQRLRAMRDATLFIESK